MDRSGQTGTEVHMTKQRPHSSLGECIIHSAAVPCAFFSSVHNVYYVRSFIYISCFIVDRVLCFKMTFLDVCRIGQETLQEHALVLKN